MKKIIIPVVVMIASLAVIFSVQKARAIIIFNYDPLPIGQVGVPYPPTQLVTSGSGETYNCSAQTPGLPAGMSIDNGSRLQGTPQETFAASVTIDCVSSGGDMGTASFTLTINPAAVPTATPTAVPIVSTGKKTAGLGKIMEVATNMITVGKVIVRITSQTAIVKLNKISTLAVGQYAAYAGVLNTDKSVTAVGIVVGN